MNNTKEQEYVDLRWDQRFTSFVIGIVIAILFFRVIGEWLVPTLLKYEGLQLILSETNQTIFIWTNTIFLSIIMNEIVKNKLFKRREAE